jgi:putative peptidoglycan lipid II flippase
MSIHKSIAKSASIIGFATFCSRILGLIRDMVIARLFGVYLYAQAFVIAFRIPNLFRDLLGEGAANAALVPVFSEYNAKHSKEEFWELANVVLNLLLVILSVITILGIIFSPILVRIFAPGFMADPQKLAATIALNRIIFPYILLICLAAYAMAILNSLRHFAVPAFAPCLLNISIIVCALIFGEGLAGLASGVLLGGVLQLLVQIPVLYKKGFQLQLFQRFRHPAAKTIGKLMLPRLASSGIYQLNNIVDSAFGSLAFIVGDGGVAALYFAYRLVQFPIGIFSNSFSQAILPVFSVQALENDREKLKISLSFGLRVIFFVMIPASVVMMSFSRPIIMIIFEYGKFDAYAANMTAKVLYFYSLGLVAYAVTKMLQSCFFALKDTITPAKIAAFNLGLTVILNAALIYPFKISGVALATSLSGIICSFTLFRILKRKLAPFDDTELVMSFFKIFLAGIGMRLACLYVQQVMAPGPGVFHKIFYIILLFIYAAASYIIFCLIFRVKEIHELRRWIFKKVI